MRIRIRLAPTLCALFVVAGPAIAARKAQPKQGAARARAAQLREEGLAAVAAGREDEAIQDFGLAIEAYPRDQVAHHELGKILFRRGQTQEAIAHFRTAVRLQPKDTSAWYNLAFAERSAQKFADAAESYRQYVDLAPDDPDGYYGLAESLRQSNRAGDAIAAYQQYLLKEKRSSEQKWVQRANERIAELQPQADAEAREKEKAAAAAASAAAAAAPAAGAAAATVTGAPASAASSSLPPNAARTLELGAQPTSKAEPSAVSDGVAPATRVVVHGTDGTVVSPAGPAKPALSGVDPAAKIAEGDSAFAAKDFRIALYAYQDAIMADPKSVEARVKAGHVYAKMGHDPEAIEQWNRAIALEPTNVEAQDALAAAYARRGVRAPAPAGTTIVTVTPPAAVAPATSTAPAAAALSAPAAVPASMPSFAPAPTAAPAVSGDEASARQHYSSGVALMHDRKYEAAVAELDQAIALRPGYANALIARGSARISLGRFPEAAQDYAAARSADPTLAAPLFGLAEAYRQMGDSGRAIEMYRAFADSNAADAQPNLKSYARQTAESLSRK